MFRGCGLEGLFQLVLFIPRELWRNLWKKQAVLRWKKEVSQHWYNHCAELRLPRTSKSLSYHFCTWSRTQLWLPGELVRCATHSCTVWRILLSSYTLSLLLLTWDFSSPFSLSARLWIRVHPGRIQEPRQEGEGQLYNVCKSYIRRQAQQ